MVSLNGLIASPAASTNISTLPMNSVNEAGQIHRKATFTDWMGMKI